MGAVPNYLRGIVVLVYTTPKHSFYKQDNTFCQDLLFFFRFLIANQSNGAILGGSRVAYTKAKHIKKEAKDKREECLDIYIYIQKYIGKTIYL